MYILILTFLVTDLGGTTSVPGFHSQAACERAGALLQQKVEEAAPKTSKHFPGLFPLYVCVSDR